MGPPRVPGGRAWAPRNRWRSPATSLEWFAIGGPTDDCARRRSASTRRRGNRDLEFDRVPFRGTDVVRIRPELDREVQRDALDGGGQSKDGKRFSEIASSESMHARTAGFDGAGDFAEPRGCRPPAVEADKSVLRAEREPRPVAELLHREPGSEQARRFARLERALCGGPLIRAGSDEFEATVRHLDDRRRRLKCGRDRPRDCLERSEFGAQGNSELGKAGERAEMAGSKGGGGFLGHGRDVDDG